jgi:hypothetical protein
MMEAERKFKEYLTYIKNTLEMSIKPKALNMLLLVPPYVHMKDAPSEVLSISIKIMEQEKIFEKGGLSPIYSPQPIPIENLRKFIYDLANLLWLYEQKMSGYDSKIQDECFIKGGEYLRIYTSGVQMFKGRRTAKPFTTTLKKIINLKQKMLDKPDIPPGLKEYEIKRQVAEIFWNHIKTPNTKEVMAARSADLLNAFNISATLEGMREYFKNK